ncbi:MAG: hypothetical protein ACOYOP_01090 [Microthrixaceae bacterium]
MITRGSKFFYAAAITSFVAALVYGFITSAAAGAGTVGAVSDGGLVNAIIGPLSFGWKGGVGEHIGYSILMGFAAIMAGLGGFATAFRDGNAEAVAQVEHRTHARPVTVPIGLSYWPLLAAFGVVITVVGLAVDSLYFVVGLVVLAVAGLSWTVRAWAERATGDQSTNRELRHQLMDPLEIPVVSVLVAAVIILCVSRLLLAIPVGAATFVIIIAAVVIFVTAIVLANRPELKRSVVATVLVVGGLVIIGSGIAGGVAGPIGHGEEGLGRGASVVVPDSATAPTQVDTDAAARAVGD